MMNISSVQTFATIQLNSPLNTEEKQKKKLTPMYTQITITVVMLVWLTMDLIVKMKIRVGLKNLPMMSAGLW